MYKVDVMTVPSIASIGLGSQADASYLTFKPTQSIGTHAFQKRHLVSNATKDTRYKNITEAVTFRGPSHSACSLSEWQLIPK